MSNNSERFNIIYKWQGQRHVHPKTAESSQEARDLIAALRASGFRNSWAELVNAGNGEGEVYS